MKFANITFPVSIHFSDGLHEDTPAVHGQPLKFQFTVSDSCTPQQAAELFVSKISDALNLIDLGDCT